MSSAKRPRVAIVDTGSGNLRSVEKALTVAGADAHITAAPDEIVRADRVVVPGQGAFGGCVAGLDRNGGELRQAVLESVKKGTPYFGICLGLQVLFEASDETPGCRGLGLIPGKIVRFALQPPLKIPHIGWNACHQGAATTSLLRDTPDDTYFYFVHSFYAAPDSERDVALSAAHGVSFCAAIARENLFACQFHPEKSQRAGLTLLGRFVTG